MNRYRRYFFLFIGLLFSSGLLWLAFRNVPLSVIISSFANINYYLVSSAISMVLFSFFLRAVRWRLLLSEKETLSKTFNIMMTGFMLNCIFPGRAGEIARPVIISKNPHISFVEALSTIAVERFLDLFMLLCFFFYTLFYIQIPAGLSYQFGTHILNKTLLFEYVYKMTLLSSLIVLGFISILFLNRQNNLYLKFLDRLKPVLNNLIKGLDPIRNLNGLIRTAILSFMIWWLQVCSYYLVIKSFPGIDIQFQETAFVMVVICFFIAIPSVPGFWGVWEAGGIFAMMVLGIAQADAAGFNLFNHAVQMLPVIITGIVSAAWLGINLKALRR